MNNLEIIKKEEGGYNKFYAAYLVNEYSFIVFGQGNKEESLQEIKEMAELVYSKLENARVEFNSNTQSYEVLDNKIRFSSVFIIIPSNVVGSDIQESIKTCLQTHNKVAAVQLQESDGLAVITYQENDSKSLQQDKEELADKIASHHKFFAIMTQMKIN